MLLISRALRYFTFSVVYFVAAQTANAQTYYWYFTNDIYGHHSSASAACLSYVADQNKVRPEEELKFLSVLMVRDNYASCRMNYKVRDGYYQDTTAAIYRAGDSCPTGSSYNSETGECVCPPDKIKDETGACIVPPPKCPVDDKFPAKGPESPVTNINGRNYVVSSTPPTACFQGCKYAPKDDTRHTGCWLVPGSKDRGYCNYIIYSTGDNCGADSYTFAASGDHLNPSTPPDSPDAPDNKDPGCPKGWSWSGTTCVKSNGDSGGSNSGGDNSNPGGGGNNSGGGNGSGNGSGDGSGNGSGDGAGNGDGSGNGSGDGSGGTGNGSGSDCDPSKTNCDIAGPTGSLLKPKQGNFETANKEWDLKSEAARKAFHDKIKTELASFKGIFDLNLGQGAGSLPCEQFSVLGQTINFCLTGYSTQLSYLRNILLLVVAVLAAVIILRD